MDGTSSSVSVNKHCGRRRFCFRNARRQHAVLLFHPKRHCPGGETASRWCDRNLCVKEAERHMEPCGESSIAEFGEACARWRLVCAERYYVVCFCPRRLHRREPLHSRVH